MDPLEELLYYGMYSFVNNVDFKKWEFVRLVPKEKTLEGYGLANAKTKARLTVSRLNGKILVRAVLGKLFSLILIIPKKTGKYSVVSKVVPDAIVKSERNETLSLDETKKRIDELVNNIDRLVPEYCMVCHRSDRVLKFCSDCEFEQYCGIICQKSGWVNHKKICRHFNGAYVKMWLAIQHEEADSSFRPDAEIKGISVENTKTSREGLGTDAEGNHPIRRRR